MKNEKYKPHIDGLRAIAVFTVVVYHWLPSACPGGYLGVDMFFAISGYVITQSIMSQKHDSFYSLFVSFYSRRVKRIVPALLFCVSLTSLIFCLFVSQKEKDFQTAMQTAFSSCFGLSNVYLTSITSDYFGSSNLLNPFMHTWSLGVEEQFYLIYPLLIWILGVVSHQKEGKTFGVFVFSSLTILSLSLYIIGLRVSPIITYYAVLSRFWELSIGCLAYLLSERLLAFRLSDSTLHWTSNISILFILLSFLMPESMQSIMTPVIVISTCVCILTAQKKGIGYILLTSRPFVALGLLSYSIYLWHWPVIVLSRFTIGLTINTIFIDIIVCLIFSILSFKFIERPMRQIKWSKSPYVTILYGVLAVIGCSGIVIGLEKSPNNALYTGREVSMAAKGVDTIRDDKFFNGAIIWRANDCILAGDFEVGKDITSAKCTLASNFSPDSRTFLVIGNSYSAAEFEMYSVLYENHIGNVIATSSFGASPVAGVPNNGNWAKSNSYYWNTIVPNLISQLHSGDVVIMISDLFEFTRSAERRELLKNGLEQFSRDLDTKGISVIFQAPIPLIRRALCNPDIAFKQWYNLNESSRCEYYSRDLTLHREQGINDILDAIEASNHNFHTLNIFPIMCPETICEIFNPDGVPLYRDIYAHPSIEADFLARPLFLSKIFAVIR